MALIALVSLGLATATVKDVLEYVTRARQADAMATRDVRDTAERATERLLELAVEEMEIYEEIALSKHCEAHGTNPRESRCKLTICGCMCKSCIDAKAERSDRTGAKLRYRLALNLYRKNIAESLL
jgi:hypothetical protein